MRHAALLLTILIVGCSGCAGKAASSTPLAPPAPVLLPFAYCPAPAAPTLPPVDGGLAFDSPTNVRALLDRESILRRYIAGLKATLTCYDAQTALPSGGMGVVGGGSPPVRNYDAQTEAAHAR